MDNNDMLMAALKSYGAANTPENISQLQRFFASNPDQLERRAMGLRGSGIDDNSDALKLNMDKIMAASDRTPAVAAPQSLQADAQVQPQAVAPPRTTTKPALVQTQGLGYNPNMNLGPLPAKNGPVDGGIPNNVQVENAEAGISKDIGGATSGWIGPLLTALLGISSTGGRAGIPLKDGPVGPNQPTPNGKATPRVLNEDGTLVGNEPKALPNDRAGQKLLTGPQKMITGPDGKLIEDAGGAKYPSGAPQIDTKMPAVGAAMQDPAEVAKMKAEVDAENAQLSATEAARMEQLKKQRAVEDTVKAAKKAVGRK